MFYIYADGQSIYQPPEEDCTLISPRLTLEIGKAGSLEFSVPPTHKFYDQLRQLKTPITVELDDVEIFRGRILSNQRDFNNIRKIYCEGDLAYLVDSVQKSEKYKGTTHELFRKIVEAHNARMEPEKQFRVGQITVEDREITVTGQSDQTEDPDTGDFDYKQIAINSMSNEWKTSLDYIENYLIDYCGGYLRTRREGDVTYLDYVENYGNKAPQEIAFGVNMIDLTEEANAEELFTVLIPLGDENLTIASVNNGSDELIDEEGVAAYGRIIKTQVFDNVNQASTLLENGKRFLENHANISVTLTVKALDIHLIDRSVQEIHVGDIVRLNSSPHSIVQELTCTRLEYDIENPANNTYTFGTPKQSLTERYRKDKAKAEDSASNSAAEAAGGSGIDEVSPEPGGGGGGGGGGAGGAAEKKARELLDRFYDAWINVDPESAHVDLGAVYKELKDAKDILKREVGIDLDGVSGNINIHALNERYNELGEIVQSNRAAIDVLANDTESKIELVTSWVDEVKGAEASHYASIVLRANALESAIEMKADRVDVDAFNISLNAFGSKLENCGEAIKDVEMNLSAVFQRVDENQNAIHENAASIDLLANDLESRITLETKNIKGDIAALVLKTDQQGSSIEANARNITLNANNVTNINGKITNINSEITNVKNLVAKKLSTDELSAKIAAISGGITTKGLGVNGGSFYVSSGSTAVFNRSVNVTGSLTVNSNAVALKSDLTGLATQSWVTQQLSNISVNWSSVKGKPTYFPAVRHCHSFSGSASVKNGHQHKYTVNGKSYNTGGVSTNATHSISISGNTGYSGG